MKLHNFETEPYPVYDAFAISKDQIKDLNTMINYEKLDFVVSQVHDTSTRQNMVKHDLRQSTRAVVNNKEVFEWIDNHVVSILNNTHKQNTFHLLRDELDVVKYEKGDFFLPHQDFVKFKCDHLKCCSLLICLYANCKGGETRLYLKEGVIDIPNTKTTGGCLMFRNEVIHEGVHVVNGTKVILKANLYMIPLSIKNYKIHGDDFVLIGFKNDDRVFILQMDIIKKYPHSALFGYCEHHKLELGEKLILDTIDYETFGKIYDRLLDPTLEISSDMMKLMDQHGLVDETVCSVSKIFDECKNQEMKMFNDFMNGAEKFYLTKNAEDYTKFKKIFANRPDIIPIQLISTNNKIIGINVFNGIPIYYGESTKDVCFLSEHIPGPIHEINIPYARKVMLFTNYYENPNTVEDVTMWREHRADPNNFYSEDELVYLQEFIKVYSLDTEMRHDENFNESYQRKHPNWDNYKRVKKMFRYDISDLETKIHDIIGTEKFPDNKYGKPMNGKEELMYIIKIQSTKWDYQMPEKYTKKYSSISKLVAGAYHCNENNYYAISLDIYLGFFRV